MKPMPHPPEPRHDSAAKRKHAWSRILDLVAEQVVQELAAEQAGNPSPAINSKLRPGTKAPH